MKRILIIDDSISFTTIYSDLLKSKGHIVETANSGYEGLDKVPVFNPDIVITDIIMPDTDGVNILLTIKEKFPKIRVITVTSGGKLDASYYMDMCIKLGSYGSLKKPFEDNDLLRLIEN